MEKSEVAILSNKNEYTTFSFNGITLTFLTSKNLEKYTKIKTWDNGYMVVMAKNKSQPEHEDYIDLQPILENLYMNSAIFLRNIKSVEIRYE